MAVSCNRKLVYCVHNHKLMYSIRQLLMQSSQSGRGKTDMEIRKESYFASVYPEKMFDVVLRKVTRRSLRKLGVEE